MVGIPSLGGLLYLSWHGVANGKYFLFGICLFFVGLSCYMVLSTLRSKLVLFADRIEIHDLTKTRSLARDNIAGWRILGGGIVFEQKDNPKKKVSTAWIYRTDDEFERWIAEVENSDAKELESAIDAVANDTSMGANEDERFENLARASRVARFLNILGGVLFVWAFFFPRPYELVIILLLAAPWLAALVASRSHGLLQFDQQRGSAKPNIAILSILTMVAVPLRAVLDYQTIGWVTQTIATLFIGFALFAALRAAYADLRTNRTNRVVTFAFALFYSLGAALHVNALADFSKVERNQYVVREKTISRGKYTTYRIALGKADENAPNVDSAEVTRGFYDSIQADDTVCLDFRPGALRIRWFTVGPCPGSQ
jgi:hypothetical protein